MSIAGRRGVGLCTNHASIVVAQEFGSSKRVGAAITTASNELNELNESNLGLEGAHFADFAPLRLHEALGLN